MKIPDQVRKTVAFLAFKDLTSGDLVLVGSAFFLGITEGDGPVSRAFLVTARHVIEALKAKGCDNTYVRINRADRDEIDSIEIPIGMWKFHPSDGSIDVAIYETHIPETADHLAIPTSMGASSTKMLEHEVDLGDEVFVSGLFKHHYGNTRNIPIVRTGNIAALDEERVTTKKYGDIDAYLIEARSIGGLSGSPVFINLSGPRNVGGSLQLGSGVAILFLGLIHGHYDVTDEIIENLAEEDAALKVAAVNAGIAVVVPFNSIMKVIEETPPPQYFSIPMIPR